MPRITQPEALAYHRRWRAVSALQKKEYQSTLPKQKFLQFLSLVASHDLFKKKSKKRLAESIAVSKRWLRLKENSKNGL